MVRNKFNYIYTSSLKKSTQARSSLRTRNLRCCRKRMMSYRATVYGGYSDEGDEGKQQEQERE